MRTITHLSDLHFGRVDAAVLKALSDFLELSRPDLLAVSGDLTRSAKTAEFLDRLDMPKIIVPGNHGLPQYKLFNRFFQTSGQIPALHHGGYGAISCR